MTSIASRRRSASASASSAFGASDFSLLLDLPDDIKLRVCDLVETPHGHQPLPRRAEARPHGAERNYMA